MPILLTISKTYLFEDALFFLNMITMANPKKYKRRLIKVETQGTSLVVQWLRIRLPMQATWV